ncbi:MAG: cell division protein ZapA [Rhizobacter sp.]|nr:cell division protein ZapA [Rhizobacter sp.]
MKQLEVTICGQSYLLGCPEGGQARLLEAVARVDREMTSIRESGKVKARERIAVLAALNLAYGLTEKPAMEALPAAQLSTVARLDVPLDIARLDALMQRVDAALEQPSTESSRSA